MKPRFDRKRILFLDDGTSPCEPLEAALQNMGYDVVLLRELRSLESLATQGPFSFGILKLPWNGRHFDSIFNDLRNQAELVDLRWLMVLPDLHDENREELFLNRVLGIIRLSTRPQDITEEIESMELCLNDSVFEVTNALEFVSGVQLRNEKKSLVESRLNRRMHALHMSSLKEYADYFLSHRTKELPKALSLVTTHTTEFFREEAHFDYLFEKVFPHLFATKREITIWSAASSTGQEVYSLAISVLEYMRTHGLQPDRYKVTVHGTDIDLASIDVAKEGVYRRDQVDEVSADLIKRYFDEGTGSLREFVRVKDEVHRLCQFNRLNLVADPFPLRDIDFIFLRNVLIYFKPQDVTDIVSKMSPTLTPEGLLFLGHSESLANLKTPYQKIHHAIYRLPTRENNQDGGNIITLKAKVTEAPLGISVRPPPQPRPFPAVVTDLKEAKANKHLIVIGASTGGVEALKTVLEQFPENSPPILIVQHIPAGFSAALAKRLDETCAIRIKEASDGDVLQDGHAYIAPGGKQMKLLRTPSSLYLEINNDPPVRLHKPSVDYLFDSVVSVLKFYRVSAAILTGMGADGARGLKSLREAGAYTIAQDEETSVVFGMPGAAVKLEAAKEVLPLPMIASRLLYALKR